MKSKGLRPAEGWVFVEEIEKSLGAIWAVSVDMDTCGIRDLVEFNEPHPIELEHLGLIAIRATNITQWGEHGNLQLGRSEI